MMPAWLRDNFNKIIFPNKSLATEAGKLEALATKRLLRDTRSKDTK